MVQVQRELATQLHRQEQLHASMEKLLDRQRKLAQELVERDKQSRQHVQRIEAVVSSMATGEVVRDAPAPGPASAGAGDGHDHAEHDAAPRRGDGVRGTGSSRGPRRTWASSSPASRSSTSRA